MKRIVMLGLVFFIHTCLANTPSNFIIFGDSLSDIGNFPQSEFVKIYNPEDIVAGIPPTTIDMEAVYVPITNPISQNSEIYNLVTPQHDVISLHYPKLSVATHIVLRQPQAGIDEITSLTQHLSPHYQRPARSVGWVEYLFENLYHNNPQAQLVTSNLIDSVTLNQHSSIDFAWSSAMSENNCRNMDYTQPSTCSKSTILNSVDYMRSHQTPEDKAYIQHGLLVPGLLRQVHLLLDDPQHTQVMGPNTKYFLFIGGNDLMFGLENKNIAYLSGEQSLKNVASAIQLLKQHGVSGDQIVIVDLFNVALAPAVAEQGTMLSYLATLVSKAYDTSLAILAKTQGSELVDIYPLFSALDNTDAMQAHHGKSCQNPQTSVDTLLGAGQTPGQVAAFTPGQTPSECGDYLFWNAVHPTSIAEQEIGYLVYAQLITGKAPAIMRQSLASLKAIKTNLTHTVAQLQQNTPALRIASQTHHSLRFF